jgi:hypothetical protein
MRITAKQLRQIIREETINLSEASKKQNFLPPGGLAGIGSASIKAALLSLSDSDFKKLKNAIDDAQWDRRETKKKPATRSAAAALTPASIAAKIKTSLHTGDWGWTKDKRMFDAVLAVIDDDLGPLSGEDFVDTLVYVDSTEKSDVWRKMSPAEADRIYASSVKKMESIADDLEIED